MSTANANEGSTPALGDAQARKLLDAEKVFKEVASGAKSNRAQLHRALNTLEKGDVLIVTRFDRVARSTRDLLNTLALISEKKAGFRCVRRVARTPLDIKEDLQKVRIRTLHRPQKRSQQIRPKIPRPEFLLFQNPARSHSSSNRHFAL
ncbi:MAG: recombinase family protein [Bryobacteraceae bacterium]